MRITLEVDDELLAAARRIARKRRKSIGAIISELARRGLSARPPLGREGDLPVFVVSTNAPPITTAMVKAAAEGD